MTLIMRKSVFTVSNQVRLKLPCTVMEASLILEILDLASIGTVMIQSFWTDRSGQTVQTQIRLLLEEQSNQGLHCLPFRLHRLDSLLYVRAT